MSAALRLHGYPVSNFFNIVRAALIEKGLPHEIVVARAAQDEGFLARNPMGKIPVLESPDGWLGETVAILEYLDDRHPERPLRPEGVWDRARARQIVNLVQMYVEVPVRALFPGVFVAGETSPATMAATRALLDRVTVALGRLMRPAPYLFGDTPSQADLFAFYNLDVADRVTRFVYDRSILQEIGMTDWHGRLEARPSSRIVLGEFEAYFTDYLAEKGGSYRPPPDRDS